ncbi:hypothetical protein CGQ24_16040 [Arthrobacter sp. 7749]|nr:hypothetical protein CGQ24_16040 [Arthrobacter sp. 7749]
MKEIGAAEVDGLRVEASSPIIAPVYMMVMFLFISVRRGYLAMFPPLVPLRGFHLPYADYSDMLTR